MNERRIYKELLLIYILFSVLFLVMPQIAIAHKTLDTILAVSTFLFSILLAFSTAGRNSRMSTIKQTLRNDDARILSMYTLIQVFGKRTTNTFRNLIDKYLTAQVDYKLTDYAMSSGEMLDMYTFIVNLKAKNTNLLNIKQRLMEEVSISLDNQKTIIHLVNSKIRKLEWISLITLLLIIIISLLSIERNGISIILILSALASVFTLTLLVLRDLNRLLWGEKAWVWKQITELFLELDLLPYYTDELFNSGRLTEKDIAHLEQYRIATFPNSYPDRVGKKVIIIENEK